MRLATNLPAAVLQPLLTSLRALGDDWASKYVAMDSRTRWRATLLDALLSTTFVVLSLFAETLCTCSLKWDSAESKLDGVFDAENWSAALRRACRASGAFGGLGILRFYITTRELILASRKNTVDILEGKEDGARW